MSRTTLPHSDRLLLEAPYGEFRAPYIWLIPLLAIIGVVGVPVGIFANTGWQLGNQPLEPWSATVIIEIFAIGALAIAATMTAAMLQRRRAPQYVRLTATSLSVPKGLFSSAEHVLPRQEIKVKLFNAGFVKQLQIVHQRRKILLSSAMFRSNADFDQLAAELVGR